MPEADREVKFVTLFDAKMAAVPAEPLDNEEERNLAMSSSLRKIMKLQMKAIVDHQLLADVADESGPFAQSLFDTEHGIDPNSESLPKANHDGVQVVQKNSLKSLLDVECRSDPESEFEPTKLPDIARHRFRIGIANAEIASSMALLDSISI